MNRRNFLGALFGAIAAPVVAKAEALLDIAGPPLCDFTIEGTESIGNQYYRALALSALAKWFAEQEDKIVMHYLLGGSSPAKFTTFPSKQPMMNMVNTLRFLT